MRSPFFHKKLKKFHYEKGGWIMRKTKVKENTKLFTAFICCNDYHNSKKMQQTLWDAHNIVNDVAFTFVDDSQFVSESKKKFRRKRFDLLLVDAYLNEDETNAKFIQYARKINPNVKIIVLTPIITEEVRLWKKANYIDGIQVIPFQTVPFLKNIKNVLLKENDNKNDVHEFKSISEFQEMDAAGEEEFII